MPDPATPLLPALLDFLALSGAADSPVADAACSRSERLLVAGEIVDADDLFAKARYLQACGRIDPSLIPQEALDTLVAGIVRLFGPSLSSPALPVRAAA